MTVPDYGTLTSARRDRVVRALARIAGSIVSGLLLVLAFPPYGVWMLAPIAIALLILSIRGTRPWAGAGLGFLHGLLFFAPLTLWMRVVGGDAWLLLAAFCAGWIALLGAAMSVASRSRLWPLWIPALWVAEEALRGRIPWGGFPWGRLAYSQSDSMLTAYAALGGAPLLTFTVVLCGALLAAGLVAAWQRSLRRAAMSVAGAVLVAIVALVIPLSTSGEPAPSTAVVAVIQGNVPSTGLTIHDNRRQVLENHVRETVELATEVDAGRAPAPDVVVWPENSTDIDPLADASVAAEITGAARAIGAPILVGALTQDPTSADHVLNVGIVWGPDGPGQIYVKTHPVPFGEYLPMRSLLAGLIDRFAMIPRDFAAGSEPGVLTLGPVVAADVICFEVAYDEVVRAAIVGGGRILLVQTNNATYAGTGQPEQQEAISRLRAVEHGRTVAVSSTSGISAVFAPDGTLMGRLPELVGGHIIEQVPLRSSLTVADALGAWPEWVLVALGVLGLVAGITARRRRGRQSADESPTTPAVTAADGTDSFSDLGPILVVIPTYNEILNVRSIVGRVRSAAPEVHILIADDSSPDGTGEAADELAAVDDHVHVMHRSGKEGLGAAYLAGFAWALDRGYEVVVEMDADGSHQPEQLPRLLARLRDADLVLGSRYVPGGEVRNWPRSREVLSRGGNLYTRLALGIPLRDATGGYRAFRASTLRALPLQDVQSQGYCFQVDLAWRTFQHGLRVAEVPITFVEREAGVSKMSRRIVIEALWRVTVWGTSARFGRRS